VKHWPDVSMGGGQDCQYRSRQALHDISSGCADHEICHAPLNGLKGIPTSKQVPAVRA
jgi:hypothetical protein